MRSLRLRPPALAVTVLASLLGVGCVSVPPYQRGTLSRPAMDPASFESGETGFHAHVFQSREGAAGGFGSTGGGCGCN